MIICNSLNAMPCQDESPKEAKNIQAFQDIDKAWIFFNKWNVSQSPPTSQSDSQPVSRSAQNIWKDLW